MIWKSVNFLFKLSGNIYFSNEKKDWFSALELSKSYEDNLILNKIKKIYDNIKDKNFEFYERDGLILNNKPDETNLIKFLKTCTTKNNSLHVLDYGGSLGSRYFSNYNFIKNNNIKWNIIEQKKFVNYGREFLQNNFLSFYHSLDECFSEKKINCVIFSGSLQYLENYYKILIQIKKYNIKYIYLDNLPLSNSNKHKIFIQNIPKKIYPSSYPIRIFSKNIFFNELKQLKFNIENFQNKKTVFYGFNYTILELKDLDVN